jgi:Ca2+-binding RTX toxin-like protein
MAFYFGTPGDDVYSGTTDNDYVSGGNGNDILNGQVGDDEILGGNGSDTLTGGYGNDDASGGNGNDDISGGRGNDTLSGDAGNDTMSGGSGADVMNGGKGIDTLDFAGAPEVAPVFGITGVLVDLLAGEGYVGDSQGDTYSGFDNIVGSAFNDGLIGNDGDNVISGGNGYDVIDGADGNDTLDGGLDRDAVSYYRSDAAVNVDLAFNFAFGGDAEGDQISGFEDLVGSLFNDSLFGNDDANYIAGRGGDDLIEGDGDNDTVDGDAGHDTLRGGTGNDFIDGDYDDDSMSGGAGTDTFRFNLLAVLGEHGDDVILDFSVTADQLRFDGISSLSELDIVQSGADTLITYDGGFDSSVRLVGIDADDLLANAGTAITFG